jgi:UDP-N-acetylglucosamine--N-acetylmuramyl-(pentapeptide) pyrophosphoryl-undecaprenol N-acetylglucosamine transferase
MASGPVVIMAGGTGGHIFPGLAVAEALRQRDRRVLWLGTPRGLEAEIVPPRGFEVEWISIGGLRGKGALAWVITPIKALAAVCRLLVTFWRRRPSAVLGMGGFVSGPGGVAAWLARSPLIIHEQNAVAGTANRLLARLAQRIYAAFPGAFPAGIAYQVIGNPVRSEIAAVPEPSVRFAQRRNASAHLLIVGGSQGARVLNELVPAALGRLPAEKRPLVWHQAGRGLDAALAAYDAARISADAVAFIDDMARAYAWADLVIARAGALTIAELEAAGVGALLVPYPFAIDDHQTLNAKRFCVNGAGILIPESELSAERLARELSELLENRGRLLAMAEAAREQAKAGAAETLAEACIDVAENAP